MRVFIAIELNKEVIEQLAGIQHKLIEVIGDEQIKWVKPANLHLTLKFLGEITEQQLQKVKTAVEEVANKIAEFVLSFSSSLGAFPTLKNPKVIWLGITEGKDKVITLNELIEEKLKNVGIKKEEKEFMPHLTLARIKKGNYPKIVEAIKTVELPQLDKITVKEISIMKSTLTPSGPIYERLYSIPLPLQNIEKINLHQY